MATITAKRTKTIGAITLVTFVVAAAAAAAVRAIGDGNGLVVTTYRTDTPSRVSVVEVAGAGAIQERPIAFLVHGFQCNKSMMVPLAKRLAARGIDAYAVDLPGHGASLERFSEERARAAAREALDAIVAARKIRRDRVALVGHSYGANILARIAGEGDGHGTIVMLGPSYEGGLSPGTAGNLLVLTAEREHPHIAGFARDMLRDATTGTLDAAGDISGDLRRGDARAWQVVPATDHVSLLFSDGALEQASDWLAGSLRVPSRVHVPRPWSALAFAFLALAAAVAMARATAAAWPKPPGIEAEVPARRVGPGWLAAICVAALAIAALVGRHFTVLASLRLLEGERIASLLATAGLSMLVLGSRRVPWPGVGKVARGLPIAGVAFAIVYLAIVHAADVGIYRVSLSGIAPERASAAVVLTAALLPFFAFAGGVLDGLWSSRGGGARGAAWTGVATVALCAATATAVQLMDPRLGRFAVPFGAVCLFAMAVGAVLTRAAKNPAVGAIFSSAVAAWVIAIGFVRY